MDDASYWDDLVRSVTGVVYQGEKKFCYPFSPCDS